MLYHAGPHLPGGGAIGIVVPVDVIVVIIEVDEVDDIVVISSYIVIVDGSTGQTAVSLQFLCICGTSSSLSARAYP